MVLANPTPEELHILNTNKNTAFSASSTKRAGHITNAGCLQL
jgi:hypothetical protein